MVKIRRNNVLLFILVAVTIINPQLSHSFSENLVINFIKSNQLWDPSYEYGGFKNSIKDNSSVMSTAQAIISLNNLNVENVTINDGVISYISGCEQVDGGFPIDSISSISTLRSTFWAISALNSLDALDWINTETIFWIADRFMYNISEPWNYGGFENKENSSSVDLEFTFYGIATLSILDKLGEINESASLSYVKSKQLDDGGFEILEGIGFSDLAATFYAVSTLFIIDGLKQINISSLIAYLSSKQNLNISDSENYGGFGNVPNFACNGMETYFAVESLNILGELDQINITASILYLESLQLSNGAFTIVYGIDQPTVAFTYYALTGLITLALYNSPYILDWVVWISILLACVAGISCLIAAKYLKLRKKNRRTLKIQRLKKR